MFSTWHYYLLKQYQLNPFFKVNLPKKALCTSSALSHHLNWQPLRLAGHLHMYIQTHIFTLSVR
uniref:Uncharacterized protein n=1 Tax=Anguilla anguilla TaxID=7936 RepID=A0A0E9TX84_ANGAN